MKTNVDVQIEATTNDVQIFGAMIEGIERVRTFSNSFHSCPSVSYLSVTQVTNLITRCAVFERLYLLSSFAITDQLVQAMIRLYAAILKYLVQASHYYGQRTSSKLLSLQFRRYY